MWTKLGCGNKYLRKGNILLSVKCGDWDMEKKEIRYCNDCKQDGGEQ